jgi:hypothetical protein
MGLPPKAKGGGPRNIVLHQTQGTVLVVMESPVVVGRAHQRLGVKSVAGAGHPDRPLVAVQVVMHSTSGTTKG